MSLFNCSFLNTPDEETYVTPSTASFTKTISQIAQHKASTHNNNNNNYYYYYFCAPILISMTSLCFQSPPHTHTFRQLLTRKPHTLQLHPQATKRFGQTPHAFPPPSLLQHRSNKMLSLPFRMGSTPTSSS